MAQSALENVVVSRELKKRGGFDVARVSFLN